MTAPGFDVLRERVYDVLVEECGATDDEDNRRQFASFWNHADGRGEYRFCGALGFGGKFWIKSGDWQVNCYREDETHERLAAIERANARLEPLYADCHKQAVGGLI